MLKTYSATRIFLDENIREIAELKQKFSASALVISPTKKPIVQNLNLEQLPRVTVKELLEKFATDATKKEVNCLAIIADIDEAQGWFYNGCPRHLTKLKGLRNKYKCDLCKTKIENPQPCYKFYAVVTDDTEEQADFVFLDSQAEKLIGCTALSLLLEHDPEKEYLPNKIKYLIGQEFTFTVRYNPLSAKNGRPNFNVLKITPLDDVSNAPMASSGLTPNTPTKVGESSKAADSSASRGKEIVQEGTTSTEEELPKMKTSKKRSRCDD